MSEIKTVNRTIHPDTHKETISYRVKIGKKNYYNQLVVNIDHDNYGFIGTYVFSRDEIANYESIHFKALDTDNGVKIEWLQNLKFEIIK
ncbi:MAG: hypothetical protein LUF87_00300 [Alistipes sp.]|nr:hypothetical protein [Alistipes sp.]